ncbi:MAG: hypothetical protein HC896_16265 [Bacteroidales bacterium]|nr:hypothetical protein [Bacteroidales bacterium]
MNNNGEDFSFFEWEFSNGETFREWHVKKVFFEGSHTIKLKYEHLCDTGVLVKTLNVTNTATPHVEIHTKGDIIGCKGDMFVFETNKPFETYNWSFGDGATGNMQFETMLTWQTGNTQ